MDTSEEARLLWVVTGDGQVAYDVALTVKHALEAHRGIIGIVIVFAYGHHAYAFHVDILGQTYADAVVPLVHIA